MLLDLLVLDITTPAPGIYAVGGVRALVPTRKAVLSSPGESKASVETFFFLYFLYKYMYMTIIFKHLLIYTPLIICVMLI